MDVSGPHAGQPLLTAGAPAAAAEAGLVLLHGRGATAQGVTNLFAPATGHGVAVFAPEAERSRWFPDPASAPREANEPWLTSAVECVRAALDAADRIGLGTDEVVVAGFSQGAVVAGEFALRTPARYGGLAVLSGALPGDDPAAPIASRAGSEGLDGTPVLLGAGAEDAGRDADRVEATRAAFETLGADVTVRRYPDVGHEVTDDEFEWVRAALDRIVGDGE